MATVKRVTAPVRNPYPLNVGTKPYTYSDNTPTSPDVPFAGADTFGIREFLYNLTDFRNDVNAAIPGVLVGGAVLVVGVILIYAGVLSLAAEPAAQFVGKAAKAAVG